ncbi:MAG: DUF4089 domain-containing protein [Cyanobacteria bacterium P01_A01_bin.123]
MADPQFDAQIYVRQMAQLMSLSLSEETEPGVIENLVSIQAIAQKVLDFPLPDSLEAGPTFEP